MPLRGWPDFQAAHSRSYGVYAEITDGRRQAKFSLLASLARSKGLSGDYAMMPDGSLIWILFERGNDAHTFADWVGACTTFRDGVGPALAAFKFDRRLEERIKAVLSAPTKRSRGAASR